MERVFSGLAVLYLFAGGAGAGAIAVCCILDLLTAKRPFGLGACSGDGIYEPGPSTGSLLRAVDYTFAVGFGLLVLGSACLMADLGRADRVIALFLNPHPTTLTVGAYSLAGMVTLAAFLSAVRFFYVPDVPHRLVKGAEVLAVPLSLVVMAYAGVLLQDLVGVAFWRTLLLPVLFLLSSLSCGLALVCVVGKFVDEEDGRLADTLKMLLRVDALVIVLEIACASAFLWQMAQSDHPGAAASFAALVRGDAAFAWWIGFCLCGMLAPLALELTGLLGRQDSLALRTALVIAAALVLAGALSMRWALVEVGEHRALELESVYTTVALEG